MKKGHLVLVILLFTAGVVAISSCNDKRHPGRVYMPDMAYSRAYETYAPYDELTKKGINYVNYPVEGSIKRGDRFPYTLANDSNGYNLSAATKNPLPMMDSLGMKEAQRLFNINCAICHGANMDAQGPIAGKIGAVANLKVKPKLLLPEGTIFHVLTYGKGNMGSYASQLDKNQRWMIVQYVKSEQAKEIAKSSPSTTGATDTKGVSAAGTSDTTTMKK